MSNSRISLSEDGDILYDEETSDFHRVPVLRVRAKDREEAEEIASHISGKFGEDVSFEESGGSA